MKNNKYFLAAIAGAVAFFLLGWLIYGVALMDFMAQHSGLSAEVQAQFNKPMDQMIWWAMIVSNLAAGFLIATILAWGNITTAAGGAKAGATIGLLMSMSYDFGFYGFSNMFTMTSLFADIAAGVVMSAIGGAVVAWVLGKGTASA